MSDLKKLARESIKMLEKYYETVKKMPNTPEVMGISEQDTKQWKNVYYPKLVKSKEIRDGEFFQFPLIDPNYGIGADATFTKYEYVQYLWQAYKYVIDEKVFHTNPVATYIKSCIDMLEPYAENFQNLSTETKKCVKLSESDMIKWKTQYYPYLSQSAHIPDGEFFGDAESNPKYGIGNDGAFYGDELCHFLYQLYKFVDIMHTKIPNFNL